MCKVLDHSKEETKLHWIQTPLSAAATSDSCFVLKPNSAAQNPSINSVINLFCFQIRNVDTRKMGRGGCSLITCNEHNNGIIATRNHKSQQNRWTIVFITRWLHSERCVSLFCRAFHNGVSIHNNCEGKWGRGGIASISSVPVKLLYVLVNVI